MADKPAVNPRPGGAASGPEPEVNAGGASVMSLSIHVIDCVYGRPAVGMSVSLSRESSDGRSEQWRDKTDDDGRISSLLKNPLPRGSYTLEFDLDRYFSTLGFAPASSAVAMRFHLPNEAYHYGVNVLVTPSACTIYKEG
jgi:5-hydroxyisourate hydrolase-like protein (transthyretin family)